MSAGWAVVIVVAVVVVVAVWFAATANTFVRLQNLVEESWRQVDVELQRRHDLVPNLVATVKRVAEFERDTLIEVVAARDRAARAAESTGTTDDRDVAEVSAAENSLSGALAHLMVIAEQYPQIRAVRNYEVLQRELADTEDRIAASRRLYNGNVRALRTKIDSVPAGWVARLRSVRPVEYFAVTESVREAIDVNGLFGRPQD